MADPLKAADYFRDQRWPEGVECPTCGAKGDEIEELSHCPNGVHRYQCHHCARHKGQDFATFTDRAGTIFEGSKLSPDVWLLIIALHELGLNAQEIAKAAEINERSAQRAMNLLDRALYDGYHLDPERKLSGTVEADEAYQKAGHKSHTKRVRADERPPCQRAQKARGRGTWERDMPPILGLAQRRPKAEAGQPQPPPAQIYLEVVPNVQTETIKPIILVRVEPGSELHTDEYNIYNFAQEAGYDHHTVNHKEGEYARREPGRLVHCNTMEAIRSVVKPSSVLTISLL
jgi:transposase-like protein